LMRTEGSGLAIQRSYSATSAYVFQDGVPTGMHKLNLPSFHLLTTTVGQDDFRFG
jgi:hypothetical protein